VWQWWNYCHDHVPSGKTLLNINLDETSVCLFQGQGKGNIFATKKQQGGEPVQRVPRSKKRCCVTHVGIICDRPELQPLMPQVIVGNEATFKAGEMAALTRRCPPNVRLVRQKSAWNNVALCVKIVRWLRDALAPHLARFQPVLMFDAARLHTARRVLRACSLAGLWVVVVPARTTWLLQPLDTHTFLQYKLQLQRRYQNARARSGAGDLPVRDFLSCVYDTIRIVMQGHRWDRAFEENGFGRLQTRLSAYVQRQLDLADGAVVPTGRPTAAQLRGCFPRRAVVPMAVLLRPVDGSCAGSAVSSAPPLPARGAIGGGLVAAGARGPRTRAEHARAAVAAAAAATLGRVSPDGAAPDV